MEVILHRINTSDKLKDASKNMGIEIDIRYHENDLILHHDPFHHHENKKPEKFEEFLKSWGHKGIMILNLKSEGLEDECIRLMNQYKIKKWFFLDMSMPYFVRYAELAAANSIEGFGPDNLAVRFSEKEAIEYALKFRSKAGWVWVDCFTYMPLDKEISQLLKSNGFKTCLVSPELQKHDPAHIEKFKEILKTQGISLDAVCTKYPDLWT